jgi:hypothetical protein
MRSGSAEPLEKAVPAIHRANAGASARPTVSKCLKVSHPLRAPKRGKVWHSVASTAAGAALRGRSATAVPDLTIDIILNMRSEGEEASQTARAVPGPLGRGAPAEPPGCRGSAGSLVLPGSPRGLGSALAGLPARLQSGKNPVIWDWPETKRPEVAVPGPTRLRGGRRQVPVPSSLRGRPSAIPGVFSCAWGFRGGSPCS